MTQPASPESLLNHWLLRILPVTPHWHWLGAVPSLRAPARHLSATEAEAAVSLRVYSRKGEPEGRPEAK
jgi:hypothetical protein